MEAITNARAECHAQLMAFQEELNRPQAKSMLKRR
ncbi:hypothetical protein LECLMA074M_02850 [Leclercia sp. M-A074-M]